MSLAPASRRGCFLKARLAVKGIQCADRSLGTLTVLARGLLSSMEASFDFGIEPVGYPAGYQLPEATKTAEALLFPRSSQTRSAAAIQNTSPSESSLSSHSSGKCGKAASRLSRPRPDRKSTRLNSSH